MEGKEKGTCECIASHNMSRCTAGTAKHTLAGAKHCTMHCPTSIRFSQVLLVSPLTLKCPLEGGVGDTGVVVCFLGTRLHSCASLFLKIRNPKSQSTNLAGSWDGAPIITQSRRHKPCSKIEVSYSAHSQLAFDASLLFTDCQRDCDCDLRFARCCAAAVRSHNTTPPLRPRRGLTHLGGRHNVEYRAGPEEKKFWASTCVAYRSITVDQSWSKQWTNPGRNSHTEVQSWYTRRQRLIHRPCSTLPRLWLSAEAAEDNLARHTAWAQYPQQGFGHVEP